MAELNVQPKKKTSLLPWLLLLVAAIAVIWFLTRNKKDDDTTSTAGATDTTTNQVSGEPNTSATQATGDWGTIDFTSPELSYDEVTDRNINVRGNNNYGIYGIGESVLFDAGKATIRPGAESNLQQIASSIGKRYKGGDVRVYGYTDSVGNASDNKALAQQRADAVKGWLQNNGIDGSRISVNAIGEGQPVASNTTNEGRKQNRRVEIVARNTPAQ